MPPRNSKTKPFKRYSGCGSSHLNEIINIDAVTYIDPQKAVNNKYNKAFEKYKAERISKGLNIETSLDQITKTDKESDSRYVRSNWYQKRQRGDPNAW